MDFTFLQHTLAALLRGLPLTLNLAVLSLLGGGILALLLNLPPEKLQKNLLQETARGLSSH